MILAGPAIRAFVLAGRAVFTLENPTTGGRFTFRVRCPGEGDQDVRFVDLLTGPQNDSDYSYLGVIRGGRFYPGRKVSPDAPGSRAFGWFLRHLDDPSPALVHHVGRCGRCGRTLTVPESISTGLGPECASRVA